jgi:hypothetical protein
MKDDLDFAAMSWQGFRPPKSYAKSLFMSSFA